MSMEDQKRFFRINNVTFALLIQQLVPPRLSHYFILYFGMSSATLSEDPRSQTPATHGRRRLRDDALQLGPRKKRMLLPTLPLAY